MLFILNKYTNRSSKKIIAALIVLAVVGIGTYYIVFDNTGVVPTYVSPTISGVIIEIKNFAFNPPALSIKVGTKVTWINNASAPHTVTSDSGDLLNSPTLASGQSFSFVFAEPGFITYHCNIHPMMKGQVLVQD